MERMIWRRCSPMVQYPQSTLLSPQESKSKDRKKDKKKKHKQHKRGRKEGDAGGSGGGGSGKGKGGLPRQALVTLLAHHPTVVEELVLVLRALEAGIVWVGGTGG